jgi:hypothetical protein
LAYLDRRGRNLFRFALFLSSLATEELRKYRLGGIFVFLRKLFMLHIFIAVGRSVVILQRCSDAVRGRDSLLDVGRHDGSVVRYDVPVSEFENENEVVESRNSNPFVGSLIAAPESVTFRHPKFMRALSLRPNVGPIGNPRVRPVGYVLGN